MDAKINLTQQEMNNILKAAKKIESKSTKKPGIEGFVILIVYV